MEAFAYLEDEITSDGREGDLLTVRNDLPGLREISAIIPDYRLVGLPAAEAAGTSNSSFGSLTSVTVFLVAPYSYTQSGTKSFSSTRCEYGSIRIT